MWFEFLLNNQMIAKGLLAEIVTAFHQVFRAKSCPPDMALFSSTTTYDETFKQTTTRLFFSPACFRYYPSLPLHYAVTACERPDMEGLTLLVGPANAFELIDVVYMPITLSFDPHIS
jgi:hypothetical protein